MILMYMIEGQWGFQKCETDRFTDYPTDQTPIETLKKVFETIVEGVRYTPFPATHFFFEGRRKKITLYGPYAEGIVAVARVEERVHAIIGKHWAVTQIEIVKVYQV